MNTKKQIEAKAIALEFNNCINNRNLEGLVDLMTDDHTFIDNANDSVMGKSNNKENWKKFFDLFPDYQNVFESVSSKASTIIMQGYSVCSDSRLNNVRAIWIAKIVGDKVKEWRIYHDTEENRCRFGLK
jgi:ketosteroid isomerase-like protein